MEELSKALREEMTRRRHSLRQAAEVMGVASTTVNNWVKGWIVKYPDREHLVALGGYVGVPVYVILGWLDLLNDEQVELLGSIPGSLSYTEALALVMAQDHLFTWPEPGYLNPAVGAVLVAS